MNAQRGRPRTFTYIQQQKLLNHMAQGASTEDAARMVGVSLRTVQREARGNEFFDQNLQLALNTAPVDPHKLMMHAARTHWRAAAWLLERSDPDRFAKRPPNSCSPDKLQDIMTFLIETALEATPPEHREALYLRLRPAADRAFDVLMPDQHESRRWTDALSTRPMPLSNQEAVKLMRDPEQAPLALAGAEQQRAAKIRSLSRTQNPPQPQLLPSEPPTEKPTEVRGGEHRAELISTPPAEEGISRAPAVPTSDPVACPAQHDGQNGIMSRKTIAATEPSTTEVAESLLPGGTPKSSQGVEEGLQPSPPDHAPPPTLGRTASTANLPPRSVTPLEQFRSRQGTLSDQLKRTS